MKHLLTVLILLAGFRCANAQRFDIVDTLLLQNFTVDPSDTMLTFPSGNDQHWVNWDGDGMSTLCGQGLPVPKNWYWESDLGDLTLPPTNFAFTSCAYLFDTTQANNNWLITPPTLIPDSTVVLSWRSLPLEGPAYLDGYKVLLSTASNDPFTTDFSDTLFLAAEMDHPIKYGSRNPDDYVFTPGYVHANRYTLSDYFFLAVPGAPSYSGKLEPHSVSLAKYAGKTVYIAFLHDTTNGSILQIDDVAIVQGATSSTFPAGRKQVLFRLQPNPAHEFITVFRDTAVPAGGLLTITDQLGKTILTQELPTWHTSPWDINIQDLPAGLYFCTFQTEMNHQTQVLVKQ